MVTALHGGSCPDRGCLHSLGGLFATPGCVRVWVRANCWYTPMSGNVSPVWVLDVSISTMGTQQWCGVDLYFLFAVTFPKTNGVFFLFFRAFLIFIYFPSCFLSFSQGRFFL